MHGRRMYRCVNAHPSWRNTCMTFRSSPYRSCLTADQLWRRVGTASMLVRSGRTRVAWEWLIRNCFYFYPSHNTAIVWEPLWHVFVAYGTARVRTVFAIHHHSYPTVTMCNLFSSVRAYITTLLYTLSALGLIFFALRERREPAVVLPERLHGLLFSDNVR